MQTFLPYPNFIRSAKVLDKKRCWKQVVEAKQIIETLQGITLFKHQGKDYTKIPWANHPAVKMWEGNILALKEYFNVFLWVSKYIHKINTKLTVYETYEGTENYPWWLGNNDFHRAMRARLIEKSPEFYEPLFPGDKGFNKGKYFWPDMETKTFKII